MLKVKRENQWKIKRLKEKFKSCRTFRASYVTWVRKSFTLRINHTNFSPDRNYQELNDEWKHFDESQGRDQKALLLCFFTTHKIKERTQRRNENLARKKSFNSVCVFSCCERTASQRWVEVFITSTIPPLLVVVNVERIKEKQKKTTTRVASSRNCQLNKFELHFNDVN